MKINVDFQVERKKVEWNGQFAAEVRGLTPNDIMRVIAENPAEADAVFDTLEGGVRSKLGEGPTSDDVADAVQGGVAGSFGSIVAKAPDLVAKLIAIAADSPDDWQAVRDKFVLPLQFDILTEVARLTFIDPPGFRRFMGNVMALVGALKPDQRQNPNKVLSGG